MVALTAQTIDVDKGIVHYLEGGDQAGLAVILLHGMKFQAATWQELGTLDVLAGLGLHVLAVDMPGFGRSPAGEHDPVEVLHHLLAQKGLDRVVLIGPSMGGRIALEFALRFPERLAGLILVGPVGVEENRDRLTSITVPTLIVWGEADQVSPLANSDILLAGIAQSRREVFPDAPHPCYLAQPDRWHASLRDFLLNLTA